MIIRSVATIVAMVILATGCAATKPQPTPVPPTAVPTTSVAAGTEACETSMNVRQQLELKAAGYSRQSSWDWDEAKQGCVQRWTTSTFGRFIDLTHTPGTHAGMPRYAYTITSIGTLNPPSIEGRQPFLLLWCTASNPDTVPISLNDFDAAVRALYETKQLGQPNADHISQFAGPQGTTAQCFAQEQK